MIIYVYIFVIYIDFISLFIGKRRFIPALLRSLFIYYIDTVIYDVLMKLASQFYSLRRSEQRLVVHILLACVSVRQVSYIVAFHQARHLDRLYLIRLGHSVSDPENIEDGYGYENSRYTHIYRQRTQKSSVEYPDASVYYYLGHGEGKQYAQYHADYYKCSLARKIPGQKSKGAHSHEYGEVGAYLFKDSGKHGISHKFQFSRPVDLLRYCSQRKTCYKIDPVCF